MRRRNNNNNTIQNNNNNNNNNNTMETTTNNNNCNRRLSRAARYIIQQHIQKAFLDIITSTATTVASSSSSSSSSSSTAEDDTSLLLVSLQQLYKEEEEDEYEEKDDEYYSHLKDVNTDKLSLFRLFKFFTNNQSVKSNSNHKNIKQQQKRSLSSTILSPTSDYWTVRNSIKQLIQKEQEEQQQQRNQQQEQQQQQQDQVQQQNQYDSNSDQVEDQQPSLSKCSLLYDTDVYEIDENDTIIQLFNRLASIHSAIPGQRTKLPQRYNHRYRYKYRSSTSTSSSASRSTTNNKKKNTNSKYTTTTTNNNNIVLSSPMDRIILLQQNLIQYNSKSQTTYPIVYHNPWYYSITYNRTFITRYYLDQFLDKISNNHNTTTGSSSSSSSSGNNSIDTPSSDSIASSDTMTTKTTTICPSTDWCGTIIPLHVCYDAALYLEPYYNYILDTAAATATATATATSTESNHHSQNNKKKNTTTGSNRNNNNYNSINNNRQKIRRMYQRDADAIARKCTTSNMRTIQQNCHRMISSCFVQQLPFSLHPNSLINTTTTILSLVHQHLIHSLCTTLPSCHGRLNRLLVQNNIDSYYKQFHHYQDSTYYHNSLVGTFGWIGIIVIVLLLLYYICLVLYYNQYPTEFCNSNTITKNRLSTVLLLSSSSSTTPSRKQQSSSIETKQKQLQKQKEQQRQRQTQHFGSSSSNNNNNPKSQRIMLDKVTLMNPLINDIYEMKDRNTSFVNNSNKNMRKRIVTVSQTNDRGASTKIVK